MNEPSRHFEAADEGRAMLRAAVAKVDHFIVHLPKTLAGADPGLAASWSALVKLMALGQPPQLRDCPSCGQVGMRAATRCCRCWAPLPELADVVEGNQAAG